MSLHFPPKEELLELLHAYKDLKPCVSSFQHRNEGLIKVTFKISLALTFCNSPSIYLRLRVPDSLLDKNRRSEETSK